MGDRGVLRSPDGENVGNRAGEMWRRLLTKCGGVGRAMDGATAETSRPTRCGAIDSSRKSGEMADGWWRRLSAVMVAHVQVIAITGKYHCMAGGILLRVVNA